MSFIKINISGAMTGSKMYLAVTTAFWFIQNKNHLTEVPRLERLLHVLSTLGIKHQVLL